MQDNRQILGYFTVKIESKNQGCIWAASILQNWGMKLSESNPSVILTDSKQIKKIKNNKGALVVVLKDGGMGVPHILAKIGALSVFGQKKTPFVPNFLVEILVANSLAIHVIRRVSHRKSKNISTSQVDEISILELTQYFGAFNMTAKKNSLLAFPRTKNMLDGGAPFYSVYECKQGHIGVGNLEPKFYKQMLRGFKFDEKELEEMTDAQNDRDMWPSLREKLTKIFKTKSARQWEDYFSNYDTCITQIKKPYTREIVHPYLEDLKPKL